MQADAGFLNHVQAGPPLAQAFRMEAGPLRNTACKAALGARDDRNLEDILRSFRSSKARRPALLIGGTCQPPMPH